MLGKTSCVTSCCSYGAPAQPRRNVSRTSIAGETNFTRTTAYRGAARHCIEMRWAVSLIPVLSTAAGRVESTRLAASAARLRSCAQEVGPPTLGEADHG